MGLVNIEFVEKYLSYEERKKIAEELFREELKIGFLEGSDSKNVKNYERVISNSVHNFLQSEIDGILDVDFKKELYKNVKKVLNKDLTFTVFKDKGIFDSKPSVARMMMDDAVEKYKDILYRKVKEGFENIKFKGMEDRYQEILYDVIEKKLERKED